MNKSKIEWCDYTYNPITGCRHDCSYCYARKQSVRFSGDIRRNKVMKDQYIYDSETGLYQLGEVFKSDTGGNIVYPFGFEPTFHKYRLSWPSELKNGTNIFVGSMADTFGEWVPDEWIEQVFESCNEHDQHNYLFLTKNPERYNDLLGKNKLPINERMWYGSTITKDVDSFFESPLINDGFANTFLSIEPIVEEITRFEEELNPITDWVIIGAETGRNKNKVVPKKAWIDKIVAYCDAFKIPVFMKNSLRDIVGQEDFRQEYPEKLKNKTMSPKTRERLVDQCCICGKEKNKKDMIALLARSQRGEMPKQYSFMCHGCFREFCNHHLIDIPQLKAFEEEKSE